MKTSTFWSQFKICLLLFATALIPKFIEWMGSEIPGDWVTWRTVILACLVPVFLFILNLVKTTEASIAGSMNGWQWAKGGLLFLIAFIPVLIGWADQGAFPTDWAVWKSALQIAMQPVLYFILTLTQNSQGDLLKKEA